MKLQTLRRGTAAAAVLTLSLTLAACGEDEPETSGSTDETSAPVEEPSEPADESSEPAPDDEFANVFGPACDQVPTDGKGSLTGMVTDPVATAASNNPLLQTLVAAVTAVEGLPGVLNEAEALTVFAPFEGAFAEIPEADLQGLLDGAAEQGVESPLATVLSHHVIPERFEPDAVVGDQTTLIGDTLTVAGDPEAGMTVTDGKVTANVLCGGIPTANATVYVIDKVMTNAVPAE